MHISIKATLESNEWAAETHDGINMHWLSWGKVNRFVTVIRFSFKFHLNCFHGIPDNFER